MLVAASGYPAPGLVGVAGAALVAAGHPVWWLGALAVVAALEMLLWVRNLFGLLTSLITIAALCSCLTFAPPTALDLVASATAWFLALGGLRASLEAGRGRGPSDAAEMARGSRIPAGFFRFSFVVVGALSLAGCAAVLFGVPK
jgi:hypothetical protein